MKAALSGLALACLFFLNQTATAEAADNALTARTYAGAPIASIQETGFVSESYSYAVSLNKAAFELINRGALEEAEGRLRQSLVFEPELLSTHCNLGYILNKTGRAREALKHLSYAYKLAPNEAAVMQSLAASYQLCGNFKAAIDLYNRYLSLFPLARDYEFIRGIVQHLGTESVRIAKKAHGQSLDPSKNYSWSKQTVRVYIASGEGLRGFSPSFNHVLKRSFARWSDSGVLNFAFVESPHEADIECVWTDKQEQLSSTSEGGEAVLQHRGRSVSHARILLLTQRQASYGRLSEQELKSLCLHEIGHALGLMEHSACPNDVMFSTLASTSDTSDRDFRLLRSLYQKNI